MSIAARAIHHLLRSTSACTGEDFFGALVRSMAEALDTRHAFLGELTADGRVAVRALWTRERGAPGDEAASKGAFGEPFSYALAGTPCAEVIVSTCCDYPRDVQALFPSDELLVEMGIHAYFGVPVRGALDVTRGLLVALDDRPRESLPELEPILGMFAVTMPGLGGVDAARQIHDLVADVPVVLMSGFSTDSIPANLRRVTFLPKPFRVDTLAEALTRALS